MGQCGCGDFNSLYQIPGPEGKLYSIDIYPSCQQCDTPVGIIIYEHDAQSIKGWGIDSLPVLDTDNEGCGGCIPVLDNEELSKEIKQQAGEVEDIGYAVRMSVVTTVNTHMAKQ